jgi:hypothetical protein
VPAGDQLGHPDRRLVGLGAGGQQQHLAQRLGQRPGQPPRQVHHGPAEHAAEQVVQGADLAPDGLDDGRMRVAEDGAHLARREIEQPPPTGGEDEAALGALDDLRHESTRAGVADEVTIGVGPERVSHGTTLGTR